MRLHALFRSALPRSTATHHADELAAAWKQVHALAEERNAIAHDASWASIIRALSAVIDALDGQWTTYGDEYPKIRSLFRVLEAMDAARWADTVDQRGRSGAALVADVHASFDGGDTL